MESQWWDRSTLEALQEKKFRSLLSGAASHAERYRHFAEIAGRAGPGLSSMLGALPILTKENIRRSPESVRTKLTLPSSGQRFTTGGTTGDPIEVWRDRLSAAFAQAAFWRGMAWLGLRPWQRGIHLAGFGRGTWYGRLRMRLGRKWFLEACRERGYLSAHVPAFISSVQPHFIEGLVYEMIRLGESCDLSAFGIRRVVTTGEMLYEGQRERLRSSYGADVSEYYGSNEVNALAFECERGTKHVTDEHVILETVDEGGRAVREEPGRILVTDLDNALMPLVRYELGDIGVLTDEPCPCGRRLSVLKHLLGRTQDAIRNASGETVTATYFAGRFKELRRIRRFQLIQRSLDSIEISYEKAREGAEEDADEIAREIRARLGEAVRVVFTEVGQLATTKQGKCMLIVGLKADPVPRAGLPPEPPGTGALPC
jgi:phenylacetate-CoA ligase